MSDEHRDLRGKLVAARSDAVFLVDATAQIARSVQRARDKFAPEYVTLAAEVERKSVEFRQYLEGLAL